MSRRIAIIQGHPDPQENRFCHALASAYTKGAAEGGHETRLIPVGTLDFPIIRTKADFEAGSVPPVIQECQKTIQWAQHLVIIYPLWHGTMPALLKGFFEQVFRYEFALGKEENKFPSGLLRGRSARIVVTMGMPALVYRWYFGAHSLKSLERNILKLAGIKPVKENLIGMVDSDNPAAHQKWLETLRALVQKGE
jgi:putative NADPH-quinone reductase